MPRLPAVPLLVAIAALAAFSVVRAAPRPPAPGPSPLGAYPAEIVYLHNDAPFVVFDVSPRSLAGGTGPAAAEATLSFIATEELQQVRIAVEARAARGGPLPIAQRISCGARSAGYHRCAVPTQAALALLAGGAGSFALRIEAEGAEGGRSEVLVTLPVKAAVRPPALPRPAAPVPTPEAAQALKFVGARAYGAGGAAGR